jgi:hypothetical protein
MTIVPSGESVLGGRLAGIRAVCFNAFDSSIIPLFVCAFKK